MGDWASLELGALWRIVPSLFPVWLAIVFALTLRQGNTPMIERFARVGISAMSPALCRYTRHLTGVWCTYFLVAAVVSFVGFNTIAWSGLWVWIGSAILFTGERWLRPRFFPGQMFPGLLQQVKDTWSVWRKT